MNSFKTSSKAQVRDLFSFQHAKNTSWTLADPQQHPKDKTGFPILAL